MFWQDYALKTVLFLIESMLALCFWETRIMDSQVVFFEDCETCQGWRVPLSGGVCEAGITL
jgi:hypothetical protein